MWGAFVKCHSDIAVEQILNLHRSFGCQFIGRPIDMRAKGHALFVKLAQLGQRHHLKPAGIGDNRPGPIHKFMQPAHGRHPFRRRPQHQMIGVANGKFGPRRTRGVGIGRLDRRGGGGNHKGGRFERAMRCRHASATGGLIVGKDVKSKGFHGVGHSSTGVKF